MDEVEIKFERENLNGVIATGSYLYDAAKRFGIDVECERRGESDSCAVQILLGQELLSDPTKAEIEQLPAERRKNGERLACQAKIEKPGEVTVMTKEKKVDEKAATDEKKDEFRKEFEALPLEKKIASLLRFEAIAFGETISFVFNSPFKIFEKAVDVMAEFGIKLENDAKEAKRPEEHHQDEAASGNGTKTKEQKKRSTGKKGPGN
jgi:ferredoxin